MNAFGETWRHQSSDFWDWMWAQHAGSEMTERLLAIAMQHKSVIEIGCGCGHVVGQMLSRGWTGRYLGYDISAVATAKTWQALSAHGGEAEVRTNDFLTDVAHAQTFGADVLFARGVLQHQSHWAPMVLAALRAAPLVAMGIGYTTQAPQHQGGWKTAGHYDVQVSLPLLRYEAAAIGLELSLEPMPNAKRPKHSEALAVFRRSDV